MNREEFIQLALGKVMEMINKMKETVYEEDVTEIVGITSDLSLEINGIISDIKESEEIGKPLWFEVYAIKKGNAIDCMTIDMYRNFEADITYLLNCYV